MTARQYGGTIWSWFRYILTDKNDNWDLSILFWIAAVGIFLYKAAYATPFDFLNFGAGCVGVFAAGKALDWLTDRHTKQPDIKIDNHDGGDVDIHQTKLKEKKNVRTKSRNR